MCRILWHTCHESSINKVSRDQKRDMSVVCVI